MSLLTPIHFRVPSLIFGPLVAKYLAENGVSGTFWKNYWLNSFHTWHLTLWGESLDSYKFCRLVANFLHFPKFLHKLLRYLKYHDTLVAKWCLNSSGTKFSWRIPTCVAHDCKIEIFIAYFWMRWVVIRVGVYCSHLWAQLVYVYYDWFIIINHLLLVQHVAIVLTNSGILSVGPLKLYLWGCDCNISCDWHLTAAFCVNYFWLQNLIKGLIMVCRDLRQHHLSDLFGAGISREHSSRDILTGQQITRVLSGLGSIPFFNSIPIPIPLRSIPIPIPIPLGWKIAIPIPIPFYQFQFQFLFINSFSIPF